MKEAPFKVVMGIMLMSVVVGLAIGINVGAIKGYKNGQIAALTGTVKYHLVTNNVNEVTWEWK